MKYAAQNQRMHRSFTSFIQPNNSFINLWNKACRWSHKYALFTIKYTFLSTAKITGFLYDVFCHNTMKFLLILLCCKDLFQLFFHRHYMHSLLPVFLFCLSKN